MRTLCLVAVLSLAALLGSACSSKKDEGNPSCTPPPAGIIAVDFTMTNGAAASGRMASFRVLEGTTAVVCTTSLVPASGSLHFAHNAPNPTLGVLSAELILNSGAEAQFGAGDQHYAFPPNLVGDYCTQQFTWSIAFDAVASSESAITWEPGTACPGGPSW